MTARSEPLLPLQLVKPLHELPHTHKHSHIMPSTLLRRAFTDGGQDTLGLLDTLGAQNMQDTIETTDGFHFTAHA
jgi:hypothetical protein